jgi:DNA-binding GntR family transcriptional regulator
MTEIPGTDELQLNLRRESTAEQVAGALRDLIVHGRLAPGTHLREGPLSAQLGVSRNTVREATHILVSQGLVRRAIHRGAYVSELDAEDVRDLYRVRRLVELTAARELAAGADLAPLRAAVDAMAEAVATNDAEQALDADLRFHEVLVELMGSERLGALYDGIDAETRLCVALAGAADVKPKQLLREQKAILGALSHGKADEAVELLERHLADGEQRLLDLLSAAPSA